MARRGAVDSPPADRFGNNSRDNLRGGSNQRNFYGRKYYGQSNNGGHNSSSGHLGARGRGGYNSYNRQNRHGGVPTTSNFRQQRARSRIFPSSSNASSNPQQLQSMDVQKISEPATIIWCEGGIGEVMSPMVWRSTNLHVYFDATKTKLEIPGGWEDLRTELESGVEMDVSYSLSREMRDQLAKGGRRVERNGGDTHFFVCIESIVDLRVSRCSSLRTHEQTVVIARRDSGAAFLINNSGERTVLHPNFLPVDGVRHAILEKAQGQQLITTSEMDDSPSSLCVIGRSLAVRVAPAPCWVPTIYDCDRGVTRWAVSAEPYGEEKQGRAVVVKCTAHSVSLCPVEGDLANRRTSLHAPIIQMNGEIKRDIVVVGSCWRFRACRELPGRSAVWRAFQVDYELECDPPMDKAVIDSFLPHNELIDLEGEEEVLVPLGEERKTSPVLVELAELDFLFAHPSGTASEATSYAAPTEMSSVDSVLMFEPIDDLLDSETFAIDIFKPSSLRDEWCPLGVAAEEAVRNEKQLRNPSLPRLNGGEDERGSGVFLFGDERPDMRVQSKMKKKRRRKSHFFDSDDNSLMETEKREPTRGSDSSWVEVHGYSLSHEEGNENAFSDEEKSEKKRKKEMKEDRRLKKDLASIAVSLATDEDDLFTLLHGGVSDGAAAKWRQQGNPPPPPPASPSQSTQEDDGLFDLLRNGTKAESSTSSEWGEEEEETEGAASGVPWQSSSLSLFSVDGLPSRPRAPRFSILPYPEQPRYPDGWWFRPSRSRPPPVEGREEAKKKREEAEETWKKHEKEHESVPDAPVGRVPVDESRACLMGTLKMREQKMLPMESKGGIILEEERREKKEGEMPAMNIVLVDLSPPSAADSMQPEMKLHDNLKDLF
ncbi:hypothetical protein PMAYCL1PPCAC_28998 [Pristionchus mayeri]|uniref:Uncharacterized protein n=1 Tax=Pristionchus mayeri TaxID=1317129 RepID=A0AAN5D8H3_9BILA|nr:hypothetical protein PMAYCL1PPCAC_28998 [Pristionchus mayeri]